MAVMMDLAVGIIGGLLLLAVPVAAKKIRDASERRSVREWLRSNTRDEPAESHKTSEQISAGVTLPVNRVQLACETDDRILRSSDGAWSVWREKPQSIYEKRGPLVLNL